MRIECVYRCARNQYVYGTSCGVWLCLTASLIQGVSLGVADGVGGWTDSGVDPSLFSQALMYHAQRYAKAAWPGEPEVDPTQEYEEREQVEGWELTPLECLESAYGGVLRERNVLAGKLPFWRSRCMDVILTDVYTNRFKHSMYTDVERVKWSVARRKVGLVLQQWPETC